MGVVVGVASIPIKLDLSGVAKQVSQGGKEAAEGFTRDVNGRLRDSRGKFVKSGEGVGDDLGTGVSKGGKKAADGLTKQFSGAFKKIAVVAGGFAIGSELIDIIGMGSSLDAMRKKVTTVFEGSAADIRKWADRSNEALGLTDEQVSTLAANFGDLMKPMGFTSTQAADMSKKVIDLSGALSAWSGGTRNAAEVSDILTKAMLGERDELKSLGISISESDVTTRLAAKGQSELTGVALQQAEAVATQELIFEKSTDAQKAWADGSMDAQKSQNNLKATISELRESLANRLAPVVASVVAWLGENLPAALDTAGDAFGWISDKVAPIGGLLGTLADVGRRVFDVFRENPELFAIVGAGILHFLIPAVVASTTAWMANAAAVIIANAPLIAISLAIGALVAGVIYAYNHFEVFRNVVDTVARVVKDVAMKAFEGLVMLWDNVLLPAIQTLARFFVEVLWPAVQTAWDAILAVVRFAWENVLKPIFAIIQWYVEHVLVNAFKVWKFWVVDLVIPLIIAIIKEAWDIIRPIFDAIGWVIEHVLVPAFRFISDVVGEVWDFIRPVFETIIKFVVEKLTPVWQGIAWAVSAAFDAIPGLISGALRLVGGIVAGFLDGVGSIADAIGLDDIAKVLRDGAGKARGWGQGPTAPARAGGIRVEGGIRRATGGPIPGSHNRDDVPIFATPGEWVITKPSVQKYERRYGPGFMEAFNAGHFGLGGLIPDIDLQGLADGVVDKARSIGTAGLERVWPKLDVGNKLTGLPAGGANYIRDAAIALIRGKEQAMGSQSGGGFSRAGGGGPAGQYTAGMQRARADILNLFGPMSVGGYSNRNIAGTSTRSQHALHRAWDFMTGQNVSRGNAVSRHLIANASSYGLKGLIWNAQKNFGSGWAPYGHPGGGRSATLQHLDHVHAEFFSKGGKVPYGLYDQGGFLPPGLSLAENRTGSPERVGGAGIAIGEVHNHGLEDVDAFWRLAEFHAMKGSFG